MIKQLNFALIGLESSWFFEQTQKQVIVELFRSPSEISGEPDCIILNPEKVEQQLDWLRELRGNKNLNSLLILTLISEDQLDAESKILVDHTWQSLDAELVNIRHWQQRTALFHYGNDDPTFLQTLKYLWTNEKRRLLPLADWQSPQTYRYPLLQCFEPNEGDASLLLDRLRSRNVIKDDLLIDRVRSCPQCKRAHLSFIDVCPNCKSLDIEKQKSLHCFNCGFVGPESKFQRNGVLVCPNCETRLRHIGADYDRPFEQCHCKSCSELFIDPEVRARCMQCGKNSSPDELALELINSYQLAEKGREVCRHGEELGSLNSLINLTLIPVEVFTFALNWLDKLFIRHPEQVYSLLALKVQNISALIDKKGYEEAQATIRALSQRLREVIRVTDLVTRSADDLYFILSPSTPNEGAQVIKDKLLSALISIQPDHELILRVEISSYSASSEKPEAQDAIEIMSVLANEVTE